MLFNENYFFSSKFLDGQATLDQEESFHIVKVLRLSKGDHIVVTNGTGSLFLCQIDKIIDGMVSVSVKDSIPSDVEATPVLSIAIGYNKRTVLEKVVEQCAQLPIKSIIPMSTKNGVHPPISSNEKKRLLEKLKTATKQSKRSFITELEEERSFNSVLDETVKYGYSAIFEKTEKYENNSHNRTQIATAASILLLVGPEGGFSVQEIELAKEKGLSVCTLGPTRLRTETAAMAAAVQTLTIRAYHK